jgi:hypothetical protein
VGLDDFRAKDLVGLPEDLQKLYRFCKEKRLLDDLMSESEYVLEQAESSEEREAARERRDLLRAYGESGKEPGFFEMSDAFLCSCMNTAIRLAVGVPLRAGKGDIAYTYTYREDGDGDFWPSFVRDYRAAIRETIADMDAEDEEEEDEEENEDEEEEEEEEEENEE